MKIIASSSSDPETQQQKNVSWLIFLLAETTTPTDIYASQNIIIKK